MNPTQNDPRIVKPDAGSRYARPSGSTDWFLLDGDMRHVSEIVFLRLDGELNGCGCWGMIQLHGMPEPVIIGDGSYYQDGIHAEHLLAGSTDKPDFNFDQLRAVMRDHAAQHHKHPHRSNVALTDQTRRGQ